MNLLARILSHGFSFAVVALILLLFIYRGEIFDDWDLPDFLVVNGKSDSSEQASSGPVDRSEVDPVATESVSGSDTATAPAESLSLPSTDNKDTSSTMDGEAADAEVTDTDSDDQAAAASKVQSSDIQSEELVTDTPQSTPTETDSSPVSAVTDTDMGDVSDEDASDQVSAPQDSNIEESSIARDRPAADTTASSPTTGSSATGSSATGSSATGSSDSETVPTDEGEGAVSDERDTNGDSQTPDVVSPREAADITASDAETKPAAQQLPVIEQPAPDADMATSTSSATATPTAATPTASDEESAYSILAAAREAYWLRDFETAEQRYKALIELEPDNPDGYGELGNMYFSQGKWDEAASAYYNAGVRLLNDGLVVQARQMVEVIRGLNGKQAGELDAMISAGSSATP